jgi:uncharacterized membrane protein YoaK (UPF0700 family)
MTPTVINVEDIRIALQQEAVSGPVRVVAFLAAATLFIAVIRAVLRRRLREEFTPLWLTCAAGILVLSLSFDTLVWLTNLIGAWTPSSTVFFFGLVFLTAVSIKYAVKLSELSNQVKTLAQELAMLKADKGDGI